MTDRKRFKLYEQEKPKNISFKQIEHTFITTRSGQLSLQEGSNCKGYDLFH